MINISIHIGDNTQINTGYQNSTLNMRGKYASVKEYSNYLTGKFGCLTPGSNASVSVTSGLLRKAMGDEKTAAWLERELGKATDYIEAAWRFARARGDSLKSVSIEFGEEYTTMTTLVVTDCDDTDSEIEKWIDRIKKKRDEQREAEKILEQKKQEVERREKNLYKMELKGKDLEDVTNQILMNLASGDILQDSFDTRA